MMDVPALYLPKYNDSHALIIGINEYEHEKKLQHARNDAEALRDCLVANFGFPAENIILLTDKDATKANIQNAIATFIDTDKVLPEDRLVVFFAGHGLTKSGKRGEVGWLVPVDGKSTDSSTLIRWDELTRNGDLIDAKHILFIMDACYGGLAVTRYIAPGSTRFVKDMMQRYSRQVITAGKADETVSDALGPRPNHSIFTGHLLNALEGGASSGSIVTANSVMAYVYDRVAKDQYSKQTPHYGQLDGDGDFIFNYTLDGDDETKDEDILTVVPATLLPQRGTEVSTPQKDEISDLIVDEARRVQLDRHITDTLKKINARLGAENLPMQPTENYADEFKRQIGVYETIYKDLLVTGLLLGRWKRGDHSEISTIFRRIADNAKQLSGLTLLVDLQWYPLLLLFYAVGIGALSSNNYESLSALFDIQLDQDRRGQSKPLVEVLGELTTTSAMTEGFKQFPGREREYVPRSEYMLKLLQPIIEDCLFLGSDYETLFDRFETIFALAYIESKSSEEGIRGWGPPGRFVYKYNSFRSEKGGPFHRFISEIEAKKGNSQIVKAGMFGGDYQRLLAIAEAYEERVLKQSTWF